MTEPVDHFADYVSNDSLTAAGETLRAQREKNQEFLAAQQSRLEGIESSLTEELDRISGCLEQWQTACGEIQGYYETAQAERRGADEAISEAEELRLKTQRQRRELTEKFAKKRTTQRGKSAETIAKLQAQVQALQEEASSADLEALESRVTSLNDQLAEELARAKRLESDAREARDELVESRSESSTLRQQMARSRALLDERSGQIKSLRTELEKLTQESSDGDQALHHELERLRTEREELQQQMIELQSSPKSSGNEELEDLRCKYEMAIENVRSLKHRNEELERELSEAEPMSAESGFDWEAKKREMLGDGSGEDADANAEMAKALKMTDRVIAQKDKQIAELEAKFAAMQAEQARRDEPAPDHTEKTGTLNNDEIARLKEEWREKLRAAEVDISVERAQNARVRAELEEKMRDLDAQLALAKKQAAMRTSDKPSKGWFRR